VIPRNLDLLKMEIEEFCLSYPLKIL